MTTIYGVQLQVLLRELLSNLAGEGTRARARGLTFQPEQSFGACERTVAGWQLVPAETVFERANIAACRYIRGQAEKKFASRSDAELLKLLTNYFRKLYEMRRVTIRDRNATH